MRPRAFFIPEIVGISGEERRMEWERREICAPQYGIGKERFKPKPSKSNGQAEVTRPVSKNPAKSSRQLDQRPASALCVAELVEKGWSHRVVGMAAGQVAVEFTSQDGSMRETRTILRDMLPTPTPAPASHRARQVFHLGKTRRDHETGAWKQHLDNRAAHAELNRGHAVDHGAGTKGGGHHDRKDRE
jgi:hypothetical protein